MKMGLKSLRGSAIGNYKKSSVAKKKLKSNLIKSLKKSPDLKNQGRRNQKVPRSLKVKIQAKILIFLLFDGLG